ncbi:MAG: hypothetical protein LBQ48_07730 [Oscillospiraceae bacterium]|jgi:hypothetical protein|nr:hypothetical protein [Oscillospiraceae bacterium]
MIDFKFLVTHRNANWHNDDGFWFLEYEGNLKIIINSKVFFCQPYIIILEFLRDAVNWVSNPDKSANMLYNCIETDDNPLISFINQNDGWLIKSPWQNFVSSYLFCRNELEQAVIDLRQSVESQLN